jgi:CobQ-like glutamine amidotransferase family enzyme
MQKIKNEAVSICASIQSLDKHDSTVHGPFSSKLGGVGYSQNNTRSMQEGRMIRNTVRKVEQTPLS